MRVAGHGPPLPAAGPAKLLPQPVQMLVRFTEMGVQIFLPICALCCAARKSPARPRDGCNPLHQLIGPRSGVSAGQSWQPRKSALALAHLAQELCRFIPPPVPPCPTHRSPAVIPLFMSGDAVDSNAGSANVASLMRYTLSNIQEGSSKLWCAAKGGQ